MRPPPDYLAQARQALDAALDGPSLARLEALYLSCAGVNTDTRSLKEGQLFVALRGPSFDGNAFGAQALAAGACAVVMDDATAAAALPTERVVLVSDALRALQALARHHRRRLAVPVIGLTGSNGKTTTKELLRAALASRHHVWATPGNRNNHIGLPLTLLEAHEAHQVLLLEMGDNHPGEIAELCAIAEPTHGLITNVGLDHLGGYASLAENAATKLELFDYLRHHGGEAYVNAADPALAAYARRHPMVATSFGTAAADLWADAIEHHIEGLRFRLHWRGWAQPERIEVPLYGRYNIENLLAAALVALAFEVGVDQLRAAFASYQPRNNRSQIVRAGRQTFILDAYNANPSSMQAALEDFIALDAPGPRAVVLGDMLELGPHSADEHHKLGELLRQAGSMRIVLVGPEMQAAREALPAQADVHHFADRAAAAGAIAELLADRAVVLVKGSRGLALEKLVAPMLDQAAGGH